MQIIRLTAAVALLAALPLAAQTTPGDERSVATIAGSPLHDFGIKKTKVSGMAVIGKKSVKKKSAVKKKHRSTGPKVAFVSLGAGEKEVGVVVTNTSHHHKIKWAKVKGNDLTREHEKLATFALPDAISSL